MYEADGSLELPIACKECNASAEDVSETEWEQPAERFSLFQVVKQFTARQLPKLLPSPLQNLISMSNVPKYPPRFTAWLDGVRGCAALVVFIEHVCLSVQDSHSMVRAYGSPGATSLWQLPLARLLYAGSPMVPIFYVVSGCALSLKPLSDIHNQEWDTLLSTVSSATFRRAFRLFLPSMAITFITMLLTQMGVYHHSYPFMHGNAIQIDRPQWLPNLAAQYVDWLNWVATDLFYTEEIFQPLSGTTTSNYGFQLWTISVEFYASIALFITIVGLARLKPSRRQVLVFLLCAFALFVGRWDVACFMAGFCVTELSIQTKQGELEHLESTSTGVYMREAVASNRDLALRKCAFALVLISGLFIASYPGKEASRNFIYQPFSAIVDSQRFWESLAAIFILTSVSQLGFIQNFFISAIPKYLGRISYGMYLTHVALLNLFGWTITPWIWTFTGNEGWWSRQGGFAISLGINLVLLLWIADLWTRAIDEPCVRLAKRMERWAMTR